MLKFFAIVSVFNESFAAVLAVFITGTVGVIFMLALPASISIFFVLVFDLLAFSTTSTIFWSNLFVFSMSALFIFEHEFFNALLMFGLSTFYFAFVCA